MSAAAEEYAEAGTADTRPNALPEMSKKMNPRQKATVGLEVAVLIALLDVHVSPAREKAAVRPGWGRVASGALTGIVGLAGDCRFFPSIASVAASFAAPERSFPASAVAAALGSRASDWTPQQQGNVKTVVAGQHEYAWDEQQKGQYDVSNLSDTAEKEGLRWRAPHRHEQRIGNAITQRQRSRRKRDWLAPGPHIQGQDVAFLISEQMAKGQTEQKKELVDLRGKDASMMLPTAIEEQSYSSHLMAPRRQTKKSLKLELATTLRLVRIQDGTLLCAEGGVYGLATSAGGLFPGGGGDARVAVKVPQHHRVPGQLQAAQQLFAPFAGRHEGDAQVAATEGTRLVMMCRTANQPVVATLPTTVAFISRTEVQMRGEQRNALVAAAQWRAVARYAKRAFTLLQVVTLASMVAVGLSYYTVNSKMSALAKEKVYEQVVYKDVLPLDQTELAAHIFVTLARGRAPPLLPSLLFKRDEVGMALHALDRSVLNLRRDVLQVSKFLVTMPVAYVGLLAIRAARNRKQRMRNTAIRQWRRRTAGADTDRYESKEEEDGDPGYGDRLHGEEEAPAETHVARKKVTARRGYGFLKHILWSTAREEAEEQRIQEEDKQFLEDEEGHSEEPFVSAQQEVESYSVELILPATEVLSATILQSDTPIAVKSAGWQPIL